MQTPVKTDPDKLGNIQILKIYKEGRCIYSAPESWCTDPLCVMMAVRKMISSRIHYDIML